MISREIYDRLHAISEEEQKFLDGNVAINRNIYMDGCDNIISRKKLLSEGKLISVRTHVRFVRFPVHTHDYIEVVYMCSGETTHIINGEKILLREGELLFLSQNAKQEIMPAGIDDIAVNFIILPEFFDSTLIMMGNEETPLRRFVINCLKSKNCDSAYLHFCVSDILPIQNLVENLIWTLLNNVQNKRNINQTTMGLLFLQLLNCTDRLIYRDKHDECVMQTLKYVEEHYENGSLIELANKMHYDFSWLSREIKRKTGKTYTELVQDKRLSKACYLLKNTDMTVSEAALRVGYSNKSYFTRLFKKTYKCSPGYYKKH